MSGRPHKEFDWKTLNALLQRGASLLACAEILECSEDTIQRHIKKDFDGITFGEYREKKLQKTIVKLIEKAVDKALGGDNTMLIWTMKNLAGWSDKQETTISEMKPIQLKYALKEIKEEMNGKEDQKETLQKEITN